MFSLSVVGLYTYEMEEVRLEFGPKVGMINHNNSTNYRPIIMPSFLLKTLKFRPINVYISVWHKTLTKKVSHDVVCTIDNTLDKKKYVSTLLEGSFNNMKISSILETLNDLENYQRIIWQTLAVRGISSE